MEKNKTNNCLKLKTKILVSSNKCYHGNGQEEKKELAPF